MTKSNGGSPWGRTLIHRIIEPRFQIPQERKRFSNRDLRDLVIPIVIEQFLALLVGLADTLMISYAGEAAVSSVSLVNQLNNVFIMLFSSLAAGGAVVTSQYVGSGSKENGDRAAGQLVSVTTVISLVLTGLVLVLGRQIFSLLFGSVEQDVVDSGLIYLRISAYSFPFLAVYNGCAGLSRSMGRVRRVMLVSIAMNGINVVGNAIGIFALHAGVAGVAVPSLISRAFAAVVMVCCTLDPSAPITLRLKNVLAFDGPMIRRIFRIALPNGFEGGLFQLSKVALSSIVALFGTMQIAANGVAQTFWSTSALFSMAMGTAFITVVGQYMGAGDKEGAEYYMQKLMRLTYLGAAVWNLFFLAITPALLKLFSLSPETVQLVIALVAIHNLLSIPFHPMAFAASSGMRAAGDVKFALLASIFSTVVCRVLFSVLLGIVLDLGVIGTTWAMVLDWVIHAALNAWRVRSGKWKEYKVI